MCWPFFCGFSKNPQSRERVLKSLPRKKTQGFFAVSQSPPLFLGPFLRGFFETQVFAASRLFERDPFSRGFVDSSTIFPALRTLFSELIEKAAKPRSREKGLQPKKAAATSPPILISVRGNSNSSSCALFPSDNRHGFCRDHDTRDPPRVSRDSNGRQITGGYGSRVTFHRTSAPPCLPAHFCF